ncbi:MAG: hypothetical protein Q4B71_04180 [Cardiobacteriaceae bacterium]|nr:hypothetical protein [Cardiobacteriaceae bacterium]
MGSALSACGFQLKGQYDLAHLPALSVEFHDEQQGFFRPLSQKADQEREHLLRPYLQSALARQGVRLDFNAPYRLEVLSYTLTPYQSDLDGEQGAFYERTLIAEGRYLLWSAEADEPMPFQSRTQTTVQHRTTAYLSNDDALAMHERQIHEESVHQLLQWLRVHTQ